MEDYYEEKAIFIFLFVMLYGNVVFGQERERNSISGGIYLLGFFDPGLEILELPGFSLEYERLLGSKFSIGIEIGTVFFGASHVEIRGRFYPWSGMFFTGLGFGAFGYAGAPTGGISPAIFPEFGWKIDIGKRNKWFLLPSIKTMVCFNVRNRVAVLPTINLKIGYRF